MILFGGSLEPGETVVPMWSSTGSCNPPAAGSLHTGFSVQTPLLQAELAERPTEAINASPELPPLPLLWALPAFFPPEILPEAMMPAQIHPDNTTLKTFI